MDRPFVECARNQVQHRLPGELPERRHPIGRNRGSDRSRVADGSSVDTLAIFRPSDEVVAKKAIFALTAVAAGITLLSTVVFPSAQTRAASGLTTIVCVAIVVLAARLV